jgi:hypothetical protein
LCEREKVGINEKERRERERGERETQKEGKREI